MMIVGLTGSMAMGKSTAANYLKSLGIPVFDSDAAVHALYEGDAVEAIERAFPGVAHGGRVDRKRLSAAIAGDPEALRRLEAIVHPMVRRKQRDFVLAEEMRGTDLVILDIPLLFESGADALCDAVIVVSAPEDVQRERLATRKGMSPEKIDDLLARQMPDAEKRARADFVVDTSGTILESRAQLDRILATLRQQEGQKIDIWRQLDV
jgi:dephospho-CoA kinase